MMALSAGPSPYIIVIRTPFALLNATNSNLAAGLLKSREEYDKHLHKTQYLEMALEVSLMRTYKTLLM